MGLEIKAALESCYGIHRERGTPQEDFCQPSLQTTHVVLLCADNGARHEIEVVGEGSSRLQVYVAPCVGREVVKLNGYADSVYV